MIRRHVLYAGIVIAISTPVLVADTIHVPQDYPAIQDAIIAAQPSDTIIVSPGTYLENIHFMGKAITLTSTAPNDPAVVAATVIRSAASEGSQTVHFLGNENALTSLIGFTITGAHTGGNGTIASLGGGVGCNEASPTISHCVITGNTALAGGGLAYCHGLIEDCTIEGNTATVAPGATGGGLHRCNGIVRNCKILGNQATGGGGVDSCDAVFESCIIAGNTASAGGGIAGGNNIRLRNCTIVGNYGPLIGGGILASQGQILNCVLWDNLSVHPGSSQIDFGSTVQPTFSCIQGGGGGTGSIDTNPDFVDPGSWKTAGSWIQGNYRLLPSSPCIDAGNSSIVPATDVTGHPRVVGAAVEMGAYEFGDCNGDGLYDPQEIADGIVPDCNGNQIPDECDVPAGTSIDCNNNGVPDDCELVNNDCNGNGIPDECDIANCPPGNLTCADCDHNARPDVCDPDSDGDGIPDACDNCPNVPNPSQSDCDGVGPGDACDSPLAAVGDAAGKKNRYISFVPSNDACTMAFKVTLVASAYHPESVGMEKWITVPEDLSGIVRLVNTPVYTTWPDTTIHVGDCEVIPAAEYEIRSIVVGKDTSVAENYSVPLAVSTIDRPGESYWADVAPPLGSVDIRDIAALVDRFKELPTALPLVVCDLVPETPDKRIDIRDVAAGVDAFKGLPYPYPAPTSCP